MSNDREVPPSTFRGWLASLKRQGCNVLITGSVREEVSQRITRKLLGTPTRSRTRILGLTDQDPGDVDALLPGDLASADDVHVVNYGCGTRTADAAASSSDQSRAEWRARDLDQFQSDICKAITAAKDLERGYDSAELRVSLFTLSYLVSQYDLEAVEQFVSGVGDHVRGVSGMGHYHFPLPDDSETVRRLAPLFDVRIELREKRGLPEQRWHFPERDALTSWVGL